MYEHIYEEVGSKGDGSASSEKTDGDQPRARSFHLQVVAGNHCFFQLDLLALKPQKPKSSGTVDKEKLYKFQILQVLSVTLMHTAEIADKDLHVTNAGKMRNQITLKSN